MAASALFPMAVIVQKKAQKKLDALRAKKAKAAKGKGGKGKVGRKTGYKPTVLHRTLGVVPTADTLAAWPTELLGGKHVRSFGGKEVVNLVPTKTAQRSEQRRAQSNAERHRKEQVIFRALKKIR